MTEYSYSDLDKMVDDGLASTCISVNGARVIITTSCTEPVGFTNPDDLDVGLLERWKAGERGPEFENQILQPGDALVMYNNGVDINRVLAEFPDWDKSPEGVKKVIEKLYSCVEAGGKNTEPAIWNSDLRWAKGVNLTTTSGKEITDDVWKENSGRALEAIKSPVEQEFIHLKPGDKLHSPDGIVQTAGAMSAIAVKQPDKRWNIVQLNAKGYAVVKENIQEKPKKRSMSEYIEEKRNKIMRIAAAENVSPEKDVVLPKRTKSQKIGALIRATFKSNE